MTKTKKLFKHLPLAITGFAVSLGVFISFSGSKKQETVPTFATYSNGDGATYYNGIDDSLTGDELLAKLRELNKNKRQTTVGYNALGTDTSSYFRYTDYSTNNVKYDDKGQPYGQKIISFYSGNETTSFNREHTWPKSHGGNLVEDDIHMTRPTIGSENSSRGNSFYVEGKRSTSDGWDPAMESFGDETYRGDSARVIFYAVICDSKLDLLEADSHATSNNNRDNLMGRLSHLIKWNINYPVLEREQRRNEGAEYLQGNRNPFIDHPEYACKIWGSRNSTTQSLCANASYPSVAHSAGIRVDDGYNVEETNTTAYTLDVNESVHFLPFVDGAHNASVSWALTDYTVASSTYYSRGAYTNGITITGLKKGSTTLTLSYSYDDNGTTKHATAQVIITVKSSGDSGEGGETGEIDNITSATYTITNNKALETSGTTPQGSSATYSQTYTTARQITKNNSATLVLKGYEGKVITGITLNMKSNGSAGSGTFSATVASSSIASTSGAFNTWYDNTSYGTTYRDINVDLTDSTRIVGSNENVTLTISATVNSLYINSYTIHYGEPGSGGGTVETPTLVSIAASGMTQDYTVGDTFSFDGILRATYSDGNSEAVLPDSVSVPDMSKAGDQTITLTYEEDGIEKSTTYVIHISEAVKVLQSISVETSPTKLNYTEGENFNPAGLVIRRTYTDSSHDLLTYSGNASEFTFTPSLSTALSTSNTTVTIYYGGKSTNVTISVESETFDNTIKDLYSKQQGELVNNTFYGIYMGYTTHKSGNTTYYDLFIGNGEYAILLYGCYKAAPSFTAFETGLSVSGGYLKIFNNLYEVVNYNNYTQYTTTINTLATSEISEHVLPISPYIITGTENGSNHDDQVTASRLATITGEVTNVSGTISSSAETTVTIRLSNDNSGSVFVKGSAPLDFETLSNKLQVGNNVTVKGFTSIYGSTYQLINPEIVEASAEYDYEDFSSDLLGLTNSICASSASKESALSAVWVNLEVNKFSILSENDKAILVSYEANKDSSDVTAQAMARYDQICKKYESCSNFIGRSDAIFAGSQLKLDINNTDNTSPILVIGVAFISTTSLLVLLIIKKKKHSVGR